MLCWLGPKLQSFCGKEICEDVLKMYQLPDPVEPL